MDIHQIAKAVAGSPNPLRIRQASCTAINADGTVQLQFAGSDTVVDNVKTLAGFCPRTLLLGTAANATCWVATDGTDVFVIGALNPCGPAHLTVGRAGNGGDQTCANTANVAMDWSADPGLLIDEYEMVHGSPLPTSAAEIMVPGLYLLTLQATWAGAAGGIRNCGITVNGSVVASSQVAPAASSAWTQHGCQAVVPLALADLIGGILAQSSGSTLAVGGGARGTYLSATWLGPTPR